MPACRPPSLGAVLKDGEGKALFFNETNKGFLGKDVGFYERTRRSASTSGSVDRTTSSIPTRAGTGKGSVGVPLSAP